MISSRLVPKSVNRFLTEEVGAVFRELWFPLVAARPSWLNNSFAAKLELVTSTNRLLAEGYRRYDRSLIAYMMTDPEYMDRLFGLLQPLSNELKDAFVDGAPEQLRPGLIATPGRLGKTGVVIQHAESLLQAGGSDDERSGLLVALAEDPFATETAMSLPAGRDLYPRVAALWADDSLVLPLVHDQIELVSTMRPPGFELGSPLL